VSCVTCGTRGRAKGALQLQGVLDGIRARQLDDRLEVFITHNDVDENWQLRDLEALMHPYRADHRRPDGRSTGGHAVGLEIPRRSIDRARRGESGERGPSSRSGVQRLVQRELTRIGVKVEELAVTPPVHGDTELLTRLILGKPAAE
jgi:hypothetical protein